MKTEIQSQDKGQMNDRAWVQFVNSLSGPKSANLIGTISASGLLNLSLVSSVFHIGANPPLMGLILRPHSEQSPRHTFLNLRETKTFSLNQVHHEIYRKAHQTSARYPREISEFDACELTPEFKSQALAPFVAESKLQILLSLSEILDLSNGTHLVIGLIEKVYVENTALESSGHLNQEVLKGVSVTGLDTYHELSPLARLSYAKPDQALKEIK